MYWLTEPTGRRESRWEKMSGKQTWAWKAATAQRSQLGFPETNPLLLRQTFPGLEPWETAAGDPAWVAWPLPTIAGEHGTFLDGSRGLGHARTL